MIRTLSMAAVGLALALPAAAETSVKVDVGGLDAPAAHARILQAAKAACRVELRGSTTFEQYYLQPGCINDAVARAEADMQTQGASTDVHAVLAGR